MSEDINPEDWEDALGVASQCWSDKETSHIAMNIALAEAFAKRFHKLKEDLEYQVAQADEHINQMGVKLYRAELKIKELKAKPDPQLKQAKRLYNQGYMAGHEDTVEAVFTPLVDADMETYHSDVVDEILKELEENHKSHSERSLEYIRNTYAVPAYIGAKVKYTGGKEPEILEIRGGEDGRLLFKGKPSPYHPTWEIKYI